MVNSIEYMFGKTQWSTPKDMDLSSVKIVGGPLYVATMTEVDWLEHEFEASFPMGYREYVTTLGEGVLGGCFVRIYPPWRIQKEIGLWRDRITEYWFWGDDEAKLTQQQAIASIVIGDTLNGDELVYCPTKIDKLYILPRHDEFVFELNGSLYDAVEWMCSSGKLTRRFKKREFEPFTTRT